MIFELFKQKKYPSDLQFDAIYPKKYQEHSARHFTPVSIAVKAAKLLADKPGDKVLDIGSGVGKVCCIGASLTGAQFYGVEKRKTLTNLSNKIKRDYKLKNAHFINADFTTLISADSTGSTFSIPFMSTSMKPVYWMRPRKYRSKLIKNTTTASGINSMNAWQEQD